MKTFLSDIWKRISGIRQDCRGFVVMSTLAIFLFLFILCAFVYAVGETIHQRIKMQNACDAAAYSAAVVQADGLSRMATVNRAMAWSYVQMTNRQMDYITYRWLKLTVKRFEEDKQNAENYAAQLKAAIDPEIGWWALLEAVATALVDGTLQYLGVNIPCGSGNHSPDHEGISWWCGRGPNVNHQIKLNIHQDLSLNGFISNIPNEVLVRQFMTLENLKKVTDSFMAKLIDKGNNDNKVENWGYYLGLLIDYDKMNIHRMNNALARINNQMNVSMKMTAESVLKSMLKDTRADKDNVLKDYFISIHIPKAANPYENDSKQRSAAGKSFFSPLRNTETDEMLFLNMISPDSSKWSLKEHFPTLLGDSSSAYGIDQWFIRGTANYDDKRGVANRAVEPCYLPQKKDFTTFRNNKSGWVNEDVRLMSAKPYHTALRRDEGMLGIQRVYKDSNINESKAGIWGFKVNRGNSITSIDDLITQYVASDNSGILSVLFESTLSSILGNLSQGYMNIGPSAVNKKNKAAPGSMCSKVSDTTALYAEYSWASAKWYCLTRGCFFADSIIRGYVYCDIAKKRPMFSWRKRRGYGHWGFPKWFCGDETGWWIIPPIFGNNCGSNHGYMSHTLDFNMFSDPSFFTPLKPLWRGKPDFSPTDNYADYPRDNYESCTTFFDGTWKISPGSQTSAAFIRGHARIYADDKEIFDNRYVGAKCKPWVLNERFFAGDGTILVGAAMKHTNPFVQLFNFWNTKSKGDKNSRTYTAGDEKQENAEKTVLSAFNIPEGNFMWTMSAARAGVRRLRRDGQYDQARQYQITYDSTCDAENLSYNAGPYVLKQTKDGDSDSVSWTSADAWGRENGENPRALSRSVRPDGNILPQILPLKYRTFVASMPITGNNSGNNQNASGSFKQTNVPVYNGCPCGKNHLQFKNMWNLCETDWDATLLPVRYAWQKAVLHLSTGSGSRDLESIPLNEQNYENRKKLVNVAYDESASSGENSKEKNDMSIGNGKNWLWNAVMDNTTFYLLANPFIVSGWKKADTTFFEDLLSEFVPGVIQTGISAGADGFNLNNKIPTGKEEKTVDVISIIKDKVL